MSGRRTRKRNLDDRSDLRDKWRARLLCGAMLMRGGSLRRRSSSSRWVSLRGSRSELQGRVAGGDIGRGWWRAGEEGIERRRRRCGLLLLLLLLQGGAEWRVGGSRKEADRRRRRGRRAQQLRTSGVNNIGGRDRGGGCG